MELVERDEKRIKIKDVNGEEMTYSILANFPFSSETKRMGIILKEQASGRILFYLKGAEVVMS